MSCKESGSIGRRSHGGHSGDRLLYRSVDRRRDARPLSAVGEKIAGLIPVPLGLPSQNASQEQERKGKGTFVGFSSLHRH